MTATNETTVVNLKWDVYDVFIGRRCNLGDGYFGNPAQLTAESERKTVLRSFLAYFEHRMGFQFSGYWSQRNVQVFDLDYWHRVYALKGKRLGCYCKPRLCHGDIYAAWCDHGQSGLDQIRSQLR